MPTKTVFMPWVAVELRKQGFKIVKVKPNPKKPQFDCYDFEDTEEFRIAFSEITNR